MVGEAISKRTLERACTMDLLDFHRAPLFTEKRDPEGHRDRISQVEVDQTNLVMERFFTGKSGQEGRRLYRIHTYDELYQKYTDMYEVVRASAHRRGRELPKMPRGKNCFLYTMLSRLNLRRITQAHNCKYCNTGPTKKRIEEVKKELADIDDDIERESYEAELKILQDRLGHYEEHVKRKVRQRQYVQNLRDNLKPDEVMVWMDFVSWHTESVKWQDLVCVVQYRVNGELVTRYVDIPCSDADSNAHNHYYFFHGYRVLLDESGLFLINGIPRWKKIYRVSDNGRPFVTRFSCMAESYFQEKYGINIECIPLCEYHAWSLCDSHGGVVKSKARQAEIENDYPDSLDGMRRFLEDEIDHTIVLPQTNIPITEIDNSFYNTLGGSEQIGPVENITGVGHIRYEGLGIILTRRGAGNPDSVDLRCKIPDGINSPTWHWFCLKKANVGTWCVMCSKLLCMFICAHPSKNDCTLRPVHETTEGRKARRKRAKQVIDEAEESDEEYTLPSQGSQDSTVRQSSPPPSRNSSSSSSSSSRSSRQQFGPPEPRPARIPRATRPSPTVEFVLDPPDPTRATFERSFMANVEAVSGNRRTRRPSKAALEAIADGAADDTDCGPRSRA